MSLMKIVLGSPFSQGLVGRSVPRRALARASLTIRPGAGLVAVAGEAAALPGVPQFAARAPRGRVDGIVAPRDRRVHHGELLQAVGSVVGGGSMLSTSIL
jgi:hypothetical protein